MVHTVRKRVGYRQIADGLRARIEAGTYPPGTALLSEALLMSEFSVARETVRQALKQLESEGVLNTVHGRGRFVAENSGGSIVGAKYEQVAASLRQRIQSGKLKPGDTLVAAGVRIIPGRDSKDPNGPALVFSPHAWTSFVDAIRSGELPSA